ncbi:MAG TPA: hypothetical protein VGF08_00090 [Terriglobales bacterium]
MSTLIPDHAAAGSSGFDLTVNGSNFGTDSVTYWNGATRMTTYVSGGQLVVRVATPDLASSGMVPIYVMSGGQKSNTLTFDVQ